MTHIRRVALYTRVSARDGDCARQVHDLTKWAARMEWEIVATYTERASGAKLDRKVRAEVIAAARKGKFDAILVTEPSRWSRSLVDLVTGLEELAQHRVSMLSQNGLSLDISTPTGRLMVGVLGALAEFERDLLRERILSGMATAVRRGVVLGRKPGYRPSARHDAAILRLRSHGESIRGIAKALRLSTTTVQKVLKEQDATVNRA